MAWDDNGQYFDDGGDVRTYPFAGGVRTPTYGPGTSVPTSGGGGWTGAPTDYQGIFNYLFPSESLSSDQLWANKDALAQYGIDVMTNSEGTHGKVKLPNGQIVDVVQGAGAGTNRKQWMTGDGGGGGGGQAGMFTGGGQYPLASYMGSGLLAPWTTPFVAPTDITEQNDPGYQARMKLGQQAIQRAAAAKGTLLSMGTMKDLNQFAQDYASNEYDKVYGRALGEYQQAYGIFNNNANNQYSRLYGLAGMGQGSANSAAYLGSQYGQTGGNIMLGQGNAQAAGTVQNGNTWGDLIQTGGSLAGQAYDQWKYGGKAPASGGGTVGGTQQPPFSTGTTTPPVFGGAYGSNPGSNVTPPVFGGAPYTPPQYTGGYYGSVSNPRF